MSLRILITPTCFKESLAAEAVAEAIAVGVRRAAPDAEVRCVPLADGGEGFTRTLVAATDGVLMPLSVTGPVGLPVETHFGFLGGTEEPVAIIEVAAAAGLRLVPRDRRDPRLTSSIGVGELIRGALDAGARRMLVGCGDSGVNDGGYGLARALGVRFLDARGYELPARVDALSRLDRIDLSNRDPRLADTTIEVACNLNSILTGPRGTSRVFGPQKGATPEQIDALEEALVRYAQVIHDQLGIDVAEMPGGGAAGGVGTALHALLGAELVWRYDVVFRFVDLEAHLREVDLVITAEGGINDQTARGKVPTEVSRRARAHGVPAVAIVGQVGDTARVCLEHGIDAYLSIVQEPCTLEEAIADGPRLVADCAETVMRLLQVGARLGRAG